MKLFLTLTSAAGLALVAATPALAAPVIQYQILDGATVIGSGSSTTGTIALLGSDSRFTVVNGAAVGSPILMVPDFSSNAFSVQSAAAATAGTLTVRISVTGLTGYTGGTIQNSFTLNSLNGGSFTTGTISNYFDNSNTAYGTGTLLGTQTYTGSGSFSTTSSVATAPSALFSETAIYTLNFAAGGMSTVSASAQTSAVPEPAAWAMMILGMGAVGTAMRRRQKVTTRVSYAA